MNALGGLAGKCNLRKPRQKITNKKLVPTAEKIRRVETPRFRHSRRRAASEASSIARTAVFALDGRWLGAEASNDMMGASISVGNFAREDGNSGAWGSCGPGSGFLSATSIGGGSAGLVGYCNGCGSFRGLSWRAFWDRLGFSPSVVRLLEFQYNFPDAL
jgi:hypothetical protein